MMFAKKKKNVINAITNICTICFWKARGNKKNLPVQRKNREDTTKEVMFERVLKD